VTERGLRIRFVWYGLEGSKRYDHFEDGLIAHARSNDAIAWYQVDNDGTLVHLFDDLLPSRMREHRIAATRRVSSQSSTPSPSAPPLLNFSG
jgi:hypothetical protein